MSAVSTNAVTAENNGTPSKTQPARTLPPSELHETQMTASCGWYENIENATTESVVFRIHTRCGLSIITTFPTHNCMFVRVWIRKRGGGGANVCRVNLFLFDPLLFSLVS